MDIIKEKYEINEVIDSGDFGRIYKITDKKVQTEYILKELTKINLRDSNKKKYENEINILKEVKGKNILNIIDYYEDEKIYYIILEKMDGDLECLLKEKYKNGMSSNLIRKIFSQINSGLKDMLKKGKYYRDLKPSNILYSYINEEKTNFIIKLGDFDSSTDIKSTQYESNVGDKLYKESEIEEGKISFKCDLYSIGVILYYLKTGEYIFDGKSEEEILLNKDKNIIIKDTDDILLNKLIRKLVVKDPHKRIEWDDYFNDPFFQVIDEKFSKKNYLNIDEILNFDSNEIKEKYNKIIIGKYYNNYYRKL
jgi:serine/threonine protein kinase